MTGHLIKKSKELDRFCRKAGRSRFVTVDTEFIRERTYRPILCLVQLAIPGEGPDSAVLVDTLVPGMRLDSLFDLFAEPGVVKVFHSARQDLEVFLSMGSTMPEPLFDTQLAAMVCGFGHQVGYGAIVQGITGRSIPKSSQFSNWERRPLTRSQMEYALSDVTYLRDVYLHLVEELEQSGRASWLDDEYAELTDPGNYEQDPGEAWRKIRTSGAKPAQLAILRELARFRETEAMKRDVIRKHVLTDQAIIEISNARPRRMEDLQGLRSSRDRSRIRRYGKDILAAVDAGLSCPADQRPRPVAVPQRTSRKDTLEMLRLLLKRQSARSGVAEQLIASAADLRSIAEGNHDTRTMQGWRFEIFGAQAVRLCRGELALRIENDSMTFIDLGKGA